MTNRPGPYAAEFLRRVRAWNISSWRHGEREATIRPLLDTLAMLARQADGRPRPAVPDAGLHALPDQVAVLIVDALTAGVDPHHIDALLTQAAGMMGLRVG